MPRKKKNKLVAGGERLRAVLDRMEGNVVWTKSIDRPYLVWHQMARLLQQWYSYLDGEGPKAGTPSLTEICQEVEEFAVRGLELPKARRDPEFRTACHLLYALAVAIELTNGR